MTHALSVTYDDEVDAAYIQLVDPTRPATHQVVVEAPGIEADIVLDFDQDGTLLGVEIIGAKRILSLELLARAERLES